MKLLQRLNSSSEPFGPFFRSESLAIQTRTAGGFRASRPSHPRLYGHRNVDFGTLSGASSGTKNHPAPNDPKLGRLRCARQGLVRVPESNTKYGGKPGNQGVRPRLDWGQVSVSPQGFPSEKNLFLKPDPAFTPLFTGQLFIVALGLFGDCSWETHVTLREVRAGMPACRWSEAAKLGMVAPDSCRPLPILADPCRLPIP